MKKLIILLLAAMMLAAPAAAYGPYLGNSCYNCHAGSFGYGYSSYGHGHYSGHVGVTSAWYKVNLKYHFPRGNWYGNHPGFWY